MRRAWLFGALAMASVLMVSSCTVSAPDGVSSDRPTPHSSSNTGNTPEAKPSSGPSAAVTIAGVDVDGRNVTVAGLVSGVSESGGSCEFAVSSTSTGVVVQVINTGLENVQTTSCGSAQIPIEKFTRGSWRTVLTYTSPTTHVSSPAITVEIP